MMFRSLFAMVLAILIHPGAGRAYDLQPTLEGDTGRAWTCVQGAAGSNPVTVFKGDLEGGKTFRERFADVPSWILSEDFDGDGAYELAVQFNDGTLRVLRLDRGRLRTKATGRNLAPESSPVVLGSIGDDTTGGMVGVDDRGDLVSIDSEDGHTRRLANGFSTLTHPVAADLDGDGKMEVAGVSDEGYLTVLKGRTQSRTERGTQLLPDTRITTCDLDMDGNLEIIALSHPVEKGSPGRLGDDLEARGVAVYNWDGHTIGLEGDLELPEGEIFETLIPFVVRESEKEAFLVMPVTGEGRGTQVRSYGYNAGRIRERKKGTTTRPEEYIQVLGSTTMGGENTRFVLITVIEADGKAKLELYRIDLAQTRISLSTPVTTHVPGTRFVETVLIGDFNGDGEMDVLLPGEGGRGLLLASLGKNRLRSREVFTSTQRVVSNLCPGDYDGDGKDDVAFGLDDGTLVILLGNQ